MAQRPDHGGQTAGQLDNTQLIAAAQRDTPVEWIAKSR